MTRLLLAATAALAFAASTANPAAAYECRGAARTVCDAVDDAIREGVCQACYEEPDPCAVVQCTPPYVGCIPGYFCI